MKTLFLGLFILLLTSTSFAGDLAIETFDNKSMDFRDMNSDQHADWLGDTLEDLEKAKLIGSIAGNEFLNYMLEETIADVRFITESENYALRKDLEESFSKIEELEVYWMTQDYSGCGGSIYFFVTPNRDRLFVVDICRG